jgi:hypothetical protein
LGGMNKTREEEGLYALVPDDRDLRPARKPVVSSPPLDYRTPRTPSPQSDSLFEDRPIDLHLPLALLGGGVLIEVVAALIHARGAGASFASMLGSIGVRLIVAPAIMMVGILIAAKFREIDFGHLGVAAMKLAAICIAPTAAVTLLMPIARVIPIFGWLGLLLVQFALYFALIGTMFKIDESDTWYCVCVFFILDVALYFAMRAGGVMM